MQEPYDETAHTLTAAQLAEAVPCCERGLGLDRNRDQYLWAYDDQGRVRFRDPEQELRRVLREQHDARAAQVAGRRMQDERQEARIWELEQLLVAANIRIEKWKAEAYFWASEATALHEDSERLRETIQSIDAEREHLRTQLREWTD